MKNFRDKFSSVRRHRKFQALVTAGSMSVFAMQTLDVGVSVANVFSLVVTLIWVWEQ